eukprot:COSAG01_NODE_3374_length_6176_cov_14.095904_2_plen_129_part_00
MRQYSMKSARYGATASQAGTGDRLDPTCLRRSSCTRKRLRNNASEGTTRLRSSEARSASSPECIVNAKLQFFVSPAVVPRWMMVPIILGGCVSKSTPAVTTAAATRCSGLRTTPPCPGWGGHERADVR